MTDETFEELYMCEHGALAYECSICDDLETERSTPMAGSRWSRYPAVRPRQRQLEPHTLVLEGYDVHGVLRQRVELGIPPDQRELDWVKLTAANGQRTELRVVPPIAILRMPLEYAVWEPIL